ncbi:hypothetical protein EJ997_10190 [Flaviflexus ciconiae]|uniref:Uncharacterized protein n=1 Tax=Flaviflexus ciconiae TaxID=2496867 RepID=A0A3Q9G544_9ACTO|nr:hypothetical protein [Flaviflexus ciconiae]AZQ77652.1 hypothetical protein EJ997_10190 [Flaviflexus ciconiae]
MTDPTETFTLTIPKTDWLTQNAREHWATTARKKKAIRMRSRLEARRQGLSRRTERTLSTILVGYPSARRADPENAAPTIKAAIDGLVDAGILIDDNSTWWAHGTDRDPEKTEPGMYRLTITMETAA